MQIIKTLKYNVLLTSTTPARDLQQPLLEQPLGCLGVRLRGERKGMA